MVDQAMRAIAEPRRREILRLIQHTETSSGEIAAHFDVSGPAISQHLRVLADAGLVTVRRQGTRRIYRARPEGLAELKEYLDEFWGDRLEVLKRVAEVEERRLRMAMSSGSEALERQVRIAARPETVFSFFTDPEKMVRWKGIEASLDPRPGGVYRVNMNGRDVASGQYVEVVPHTRVVFTWGWEGEGTAFPPGSSTVEISLIPDGDGTIVRLRHLGLPADQRDPHQEGWDHYLARLTTVAEGRDPGPDPWAA